MLWSQLMRTIAHLLFLLSWVVRFFSSAALRCRLVCSVCAYDHTRCVDLFTCKQCKLSHVVDVRIAFPIVSSYINSLDFFFSSARWPVFFQSLSIFAPLDVLSVRGFVATNLCCFYCFTSNNHVNETWIQKNQQHLFLLYALRLTAECANSFIDTWREYIPSDAIEQQQTIITCHRMRIKVSAA